MGISEDLEFVSKFNINSEIDLYNVDSLNIDNKVKFLNLKYGGTRHQFLLHIINKLFMNKHGMKGKFGQKDRIHRIIYVFIDCTQICKATQDKIYINPDWVKNSPLFERVDIDE